MKPLFDFFMNKKPQFNINVPFDVDELKELLCTFKHAKLLLSSSTNWTQGWFARDKNGVECQSGSPEAVQFCAVGALTRCDINGGFDSRGHYFLNDFCHARFGKGIAQINDDMGFEAVHNVYDIFIEYLEVEIAKRQ